MKRKRRADITATLRDRVNRAIETGVLRAGDQLPGTRGVAMELGANPRLVAAAYKTLAADGLLELRARSGAYVAQTIADEGYLLSRHAAWMTDVLVEGVLRGIAAPTLGEVARQATLPRVRAAVIATTIDQRAGIIYELRTHYRIAASGVAIETVKAPSAALPSTITRAHVLVTTEAHGACVQSLAEQLRVPAIVASVRPDLVGIEWLEALKGPAVIVAVDPGFLRIVREYLNGVPGADHVRYITVDDEPALARIPSNAATYVTQAARAVIGRRRLHGRLIPPTRIFAPEGVRAIVEVVVAANAARAMAPISAGRRRRG